ncbi:hypothetical protein E4U43_007776 [Claviceps pusilla]|uniref:Aminoglycoside phosphotransferase domain-containing protein n=1 Tax=Claviceps pusilla TaxID=123648 RepID=A0A9P7NCA2_9HYPO|nr:hypothetical protein E4U43_007776 [Claviceps pusilla]
MDWTCWFKVGGVANASLDLLRINENRKVTALDWIQSKIRRKMGRVWKQHSLSGVTVADCQQQLDLIEKYWMPELDSAPFVLIHGELNQHNIIVDKADHQVQG